MVTKPNKVHKKRVVHKNIANKSCTVWDVILDGNESTART